MIHKQNAARRLSHCFGLGWSVHEGAPIESLATAPAQVGSNSPQIQDAALDQSAPVGHVDFTAAAPRANLIIRIDVGPHINLLLDARMSLSELTN